MIRKMTAMLAIMVLFGFSTARANDSGYHDDGAGAILIAGFAIATAAILFSSLDRHDDYRPAPRYAPARQHEARGYERARHHDGRYDNDSQPRTSGRGDNGRYDGRYGQGSDEYSGRHWDRR